MRLLSLDLSTSSTGFSIFDENVLVRYGVILPKVKGISKLRYPISSLKNIISMCKGLRQLVVETNADVIYVEEVNRGTSRISQKSLDALHFFFLLDLAQQNQVGKLSYIDSDGKTGWRTVLGLKLSDAQKKENKKRPKGKKITKKHLAADYVNAALGTSFDVDQDPIANDICDALGISLAIIKSGALDFGVEKCLSKLKSKSSAPKRKSKKK